MRVPRWHNRVITLATAVLVGFGACALTGSPASADSVGYVRLAHLSPDTPAIDIYLISISGATRQRCVEGAGYGVVSDYMGVPPGAYSVAVRSAGTERTAPPILATQLSVEPGKAYTVAAVGPQSALRLRAVPDDLTMPANGRARVRILQASIRSPILTVSSSTNGLPSSNTQFAETTAYQEVEAGPLAVQLESFNTGQPTLVNVSFAAGNVYTLIVLDRPDGLAAQLQSDALAQTRRPRGGVETGVGGMRHGAVPAPLGVALLATTLLAATLLGVALLGRRFPARTPARRQVGGGQP